MTNLKDISIVDEIKDIEWSAALAKSISLEFYGITLIKMFKDNNNNKRRVAHVHTENLGSIDVLELDSIKKRLGANQMTISMITVKDNGIFEANGLIYILNFCDF